MLIVVELPEVEETFQFKSELEDETSFSPERQNLYFVDSNFSLSHLDVFAVLVTGLVIVLVTYLVILLCKSI